jgi:non-homologous end joining protein Ku
LPSCGPEDKGRGYEVDKGVFLRIEDDELDAIAIDSSHTIDIDSFVPKSEIDERYIDSPDYEAAIVAMLEEKKKGMPAKPEAVLA